LPGHCLGDQVMIYGREVIEVKAKNWGCFHFDGFAGLWQIVYKSKGLPLFIRLQASVQNGILDQRFYFRFDKEDKKYVSELRGFRWQVSYSC
jgi:hypothetical protein